MMSIIVTGWIDRILAKPIRYLLETPARLLKGHVKPGMTVLDIGCGAGYYSLGMARSVGLKGKVIAVDTKTEAIATLNRKAAEAGLSERIETRVCSGQDLGIHDLSRQVDFALAVYVLHHARDSNTLIRDVQRALKPGGKFLVIEPRHHASPDDRDSIEAAAKATGFALAEHPRLKRDWAVIFVNG